MPCPERSFSETSSAARGPYREMGFSGKQLLLPCSFATFASFAVKLLGKPLENPSQTSLNLR